VVGPERIVFCLHCGVMVLTTENWGDVQASGLVQGLGLVGRPAIRTRPLTLDELAAQLRDPDTMRILCEVEGRRRE
jgi:hypothetical protein